MARRPVGLSAQWLGRDNEAVRPTGLGSPIRGNARCESGKAALQRAWSLGIKTRSGMLVRPQDG